MAQSDALVDATGNTGRSEFDRRLAPSADFGLYAESSLAVIQVNIGLMCNLTCRHCHVNSSPRRKEEMNWETMETVLRFAREVGGVTVDITGGAPEMNPNFKRFVEALRAADIDVMVRTNLTILLGPGYEDYPEFYRRNRVQLVASLPCYLEENVDNQRGEGVYRDSIDAIRRLNRVGYGEDPELVLNLVFNPIGAVLPPDQSGLEEDYRRELGERFGIVFTRLHTITNVPIGRFRGDLRRAKQLDAYLSLLRDSFNPRTVDALMCRHQISVGWDGTIYDCDFNLALRWPVGNGASRNIRNAGLATLVNRRIVTGDHCFACTAGAGSSCGGALVTDEGT